jgi:hypothetical protein
VCSVPSGDTHGVKLCATCGRRTRPNSIGSLLRLGLAIATIAAFAIGWTKLRAAANESGKQEAAKDLLPKKVKGSTTTTRPPADPADPAAGSVAPVTTSPAANVQILLPTGASATATAEAAQNGCGQTVTYQAGLMIDGDRESAWRSVGDGRGVRLTINLNGPTRLTEVGLIPGYDKTDQCTLVDRFVQMRRITKVRWSFDDGTSVEQTFANVREVQSVPVSSTSSKVDIEILASTEPGGLDYVGISEVRVSGVVPPAP